MRIAIVGAGAAGCFCAIRVAEALPGAKVTVFDAGPRPLVKVGLTGAGRCNLTNTFETVSDLADVYPRGARLVKRAFHVFSPAQTADWFRDRGVALVEHEEGRIFPRSEDAKQIVGTLEREMQRLGVEVRTRSRIVRIELASGGKYILHGTQGPLLESPADCVVVTTGGAPRPGDLNFLEDMGLEFIPAVPSLYGFRIPGMRRLAGLALDHVVVKIAGTSFSAQGPMLFNHTGLTGPAILRLSSFGARWLAEHDFQCDLVVSWIGTQQQEKVRLLLRDICNNHSRKQLSSFRPGGLPSRLWDLLLERAGADPTAMWGSIGLKGINQLANVLCSDTLHVVGKDPHKEEFVTAGGVALTSISPKTLEAREAPGLFFAGEVLDIDALTGGFNLQAAWSTGYMAAQSIIQFKL